MAGAASGAAAGFSLGPWGMIAGGLLGGISSIFSGQSEADAINEKIRRAQALAAESLVDSGEIAQRLNSIDRMFNQRLTSVLNTTAIRSRGYANTGTVGAAVAGGVEGDRLASRSQTIEAAQNQNAQVKQTIAQMELGTTSANPVADFVTGAASGIALGNEVTKFTDNLNFSLPGMPKANPMQGQSLPQPMSKATSQNPYLPTGQSVTTGMGTMNSMGLTVNNPYSNGQNPFSQILAMTSPTRQGTATVDPNWGYQFPDNKTFGTWGDWK